MARRIHLALCLIAAACTDPVGPGDDTMDVDTRACPAIRSLSQHCGSLLDEAVFITMVDQSSGLPNDVSLLGASTGATCAIGHFSAANDIEHVSSLAAIGSDVFYCAATATDGAGQLTRISLLDGKVTTSNVRCLSTTAYDDKLLVLTDIGSSVQEYASFDAVLAGTASSMPVGECASRIGSGDEKLYSTWPSPTTIYVFDPSSAAASQFALAPSNIAVMGIAAQKGSVALLDGVSSYQYLHSFDASSGAPAGSIVAGTQLARLHGLTNPCSVPVLE